MPNPDIPVFFRDPRSAPATPGNFSQLYLLRRDIDTCFGIDPNTGNLVSSWPKSIWPGVMAILAGVDLLGKFLAGNDAPGQVGTRFTTFLIRYFGLSAGDAETIYQLRNSLLHSFGLYSQLIGGTVYQFTLTGGQPQMITPTSSTEFTVDIDKLRRQFEDAVQAYFSDLQSISNSDQATLEANFSAMFGRHRLVGIQ